MAETQLDLTSSVGAAWPPQRASNNRIRGFFDHVVCDRSDAIDFVAIFERERVIAEQDADADRLSIRVITTGTAMKVLDGLIEVEGAMPLRGEDGLHVTYAAWNHCDRSTAQATLIHHRHFLENIASMQRAIDFVPVDGIFSPVQLIDSRTTDTERLALSEKFSELYGAFGYSERDVQDLLLNSANTIAYIELGGAVVSTAMAEHATVQAQDKSVRLAEITEAFTLPDYRGRGLYQAVSQYLVSQLSLGDLDAVYGESNLASPGVVVAAHKNGRQFSCLERERLGIQNPNFGILQQNFHVADGVETRRYNDFALSYFDLSSRGVR